MPPSLPLRPLACQAEVGSHAQQPQGKSVTPPIGVEPGRLLAFFKFVLLVDECWGWIGAFTETGYGTFHAENGQERAHRVAFRWWKGDVKSDHDVHHLCANKWCVNPAHLEALPRDQHRARHCRRGHLLTDANSFVSTFGGVTTRKCAICHRARARNRQRAIRTQEKANASL